MSEQDMGSGGDFRAELASINAVTLSFLRRLASEDPETLRAVTGLSPQEADALRRLAPDQVVKFAQTPVLLCQPRHELLSRLGGNSRTDDGPVVPLAGIAELVRNAGSASSN